MYSTDTLIISVPFCIPNDGGCYGPGQVLHQVSGSRDRLQRNRCCVEPSDQQLGGGLGDRQEGCPDTPADGFHDGRRWSAWTSGELFRLGLYT